jgi:hypothetical protein
MNTLRSLLFATVATAAVALTFAPLTLNAQPADRTLLAQMKHDDKGMQRPGGPGSQMPGMQGQGMPAQSGGSAPPMPGMQGQGMPAQPGGTPGGMGMPMMGGGMSMPMMGGGGMCSMCQGMGSAGSGGGMQGGTDGMKQRMGDPRADRIEGRIAFLQAELGITQAQMPIWTEVANALRANAKGISPMMPPKSNMTSVERFEELEHQVVARLTSIRTLKPAYTKLYAVLDEVQKKSADELMTPYLEMM